MTIPPLNASSLSLEHTPYNVLRTIFDFLPRGAVFLYYSDDPSAPMVVKYFAIAGQMWPNPRLWKVCRRWHEAYKEMAVAIFNLCKNQNLSVVDRVITVIEHRSGKKEATWGGGEKEECIRLLFQQALRGARAVGCELLFNRVECVDVSLLRRNLLTESKRTDTEPADLLDIAAAPWSNSDADHALVSLVKCSNVEKKITGKTAAEIRATPGLFSQITKFHPPRYSVDIAVPFTKPDLLPVEIECCTQLQHVWIDECISFDNVVKWLAKRPLLRTLRVCTTGYTQEQLKRLQDLVRTNDTCLLIRIVHSAFRSDINDDWTLVIGKSELYHDVVARFTKFSPSELAAMEHEVIDALFQPLRRYMARGYAIKIAVHDAETGALMPITISSKIPSRRSLYLDIQDLSGSLLRGSFGFMKNWIFPRLINATQRVARAIFG